MVQVSGECVSAATPAVERWRMAELSQSGGAQEAVQRFGGTEVLDADVGESVPAPGQPGRAVQIHDVIRTLIAEGVLGAEQGAVILRDARYSSADRHPLVLLADRHLRSALAPHPLLDLNALCRWLATHAGLPFRPIDPLRVNFSRIAEVMSGTYAGRHRILPLEVTAEHVVVATAQPWLTDWVEEIERTVRRSVLRVVANPLDIHRYLAEFYSLARTIRSAQKTDGSNPQQNMEQLVELGRSGRSFDANDRAIVSVVDWLWQYAFEQRASDIHLEPRRELGVVRFRIDGILHTVYEVPATVLAGMTSRIKLLGRMDVVERRRPQDGRIKTRSADGQEVELRLSTMPTAFGEKLVMRIFDPARLVLDFADLGFSRSELELWTGMIRRPHGIVLVTGPTGSGKTTTLYTTLRHLASPEVNVTTIEDPIEMVDPSFNQMQVQPGIDLGFAEGVRALMRQDPDIIMVGEIRDAPTADMAVQAALTGHLVLSTLHTNDAPGAVTRLQHLGVPAHLLDSTLIGVVAQRLIRSLCPHCAERTGPPDEAHWDSLTRPWRAPRPESMMRAVGCVECRMTGYRGRSGLYEILAMPPGGGWIGAQSDLPDSLRAQALRHGMRPLRLAGLQKVAQGKTTLEEVLRHTPALEG